MSDDEPTALGDAAIALHELFTELVEAGFTIDQALRLVAYQTAACSEGEDDE